METYNEIWQAVLEYCKMQIPEKLSETGYNLWVSTIEFSGLEDDKIYLNVANTMKKRIVMSQYSDLLSEAFEAIMGFKLDIEYTCSTEMFKPRTIEEVTEPQIVDVASKDLFTFDTFIEGPSNKFAYRAAKAVAEDPGGQIKKDNAYSNYNPLFIYGKSGLGKTHILNAICCEIRKSFPELQILYVRAEDFANEFINALGKKTVDEFHEKFRNIDVLLVDDIQFIGGKERTEEEFFHTFNSLVENGKQIVLTSDRPPKEIQSLTERLCSRFENGLLADIQSPEYETRCAIIKRKAELLHFEIPDSVVDYIAEKIKTNIRQLEGATKKLHAMSQISGQAPSIALAQKVIKDVVSDTKPLPITIQQIVEEVSRTEGITVDDIFGKKQKANITHARKMAMYIIREVTNISYEMIGEKFNKHHSTVMYNIQQISEELERDSKTARKVNDIISNIKDTQ